MSDKSNSLETMLLTAYQEHFTANVLEPDWRQKMQNNVDILPPTIPFIGNEYTEHKILIYASAENLSGHDGSKWLENDGATLENRHRWYFNHKSLDSFYPNLRCQPITDGGLTLATAYICYKLGLTLNYSHPKKFIESCAAGNFGKFSIALTDGIKKNKDYAHSLYYLQASFDYTKSDLAILKPQYIIIPKTIYNQKEVKHVFDSYAPHTKIFPIFQINPQTINCHIAKYGLLSKSNIPHDFKLWYDNVTFKGPPEGQLKKNFSAIFSYLEQTFVDEFKA